MGLSEAEETSLLLDEQLLQYMDQLESLLEKRSALNALIEQVGAVFKHYTLNINYIPPDGIYYRTQYNDSDWYKLRRQGD